MEQLIYIYIYNNLNIAGSIAGYALTQINTLISNAITTIQNDVTLTNLTTLGTATMNAGLSVTGALGLTGNLTVSGRVTMTGYMFAAGVVSAAATKTTGTGQVVWTVARSAGQATGVYTITFPTAHPLGSNYIVTVTGVGTMNFLRGASYAPTSTTFQVVSYQFGTTTLQDAPFSFMALAS